MKKIVCKVVALAMVLALTLTTVAQADTIVSPVFKLPGAASRPTETPTVEPTAEPTEEPTVEPTAEPTAEPTEKPTAEPTAEPTVEPTVEPTAEPTAEPTPEPKPELSITSNLAGRSIFFAGTEMILTLSIEGAEGCEFTIQWQQSTDGGATWTDISGANGYQYSLILQPEHTGMYWRVSVDMVTTAE